MSKQAKQIKKPLYYRFIKRTFDILFSVFALVIGLIPSLIICLLIFCKDRHNPIFREKRVVNPNKEIWIWKFRTMRYDSYDHEKYFTREQNEQWEKEHKVKNDPRVLGRLAWFLRNSSLDELPQFIHVFTGKMSVIGPRIITKEELACFHENKDLVLCMKPGITGLWQISDEPRPTFANNARQDVELSYIKDATIILDIKIGLKTILRIVKYAYKKG